MADLQHVQGLSELKAALKQLPDNVSKNVLRGAVNAGAAVITKEARARAPEYTGEVSKGHPPPGTLKRSIYQKQIRELSNKVRQVFFVGVRHGRTRKASKKGLLDAFYWRFVEFGTSKMAAKPFLRSAFEAEKEAAVQAIKDYIIKRLPEEVAKLRRK